jgi:hypothetical protein
MIVVLLCFACTDKPPTIINIDVTDYKTGGAIKDAYIIYQTYSDAGEIKGGGGKSNFDGEFIITSDYEDVLTNLIISKENYLTDQNFGGEVVSFEKGKSNDLEIKLRPLDAVIRVISQNNLPLHDSLYVRIQNKTIQKVWADAAFIKAPDFPIVVPFSGLKTSDIRLNSGEMAYIYWDYVPIGLMQSTFKDSIYLASGDTAVFHINY